MLSKKSGPSAHGSVARATAATRLAAVKGARNRPRVGKEADDGSSCSGRNQKRHPILWRTRPPEARRASSSCGCSSFAQGRPAAMQQRGPASASAAARPRRIAARLPQHANSTGASVGRRALTGWCARRALFPAPRPARPRVGRFADYVPQRAAAVRRAPHRREAADLCSSCSARQSGVSAAVGSLKAALTRRSSASTSPVKKSCTHARRGAGIASFRPRDPWSAAFMSDSHHKAPSAQSAARMSG